MVNSMEKANIFWLMDRLNLGCGRMEKELVGMIDNSDQIRVSFLICISSNIFQYIGVNILK